MPCNGGTSTGRDYCYLEVKLISIFELFRVVLKHVSETLNLHESATRELDSNKKAEGVEHSYCCHQFMNNI